ncbi:MAG TPA: carboxymuconolactone decarboxylase family protein [Rhizobacter sp.]|nr:carboxymuconolactone decarboxylase family protein [Rhizobacter sp.]
MARIPYFDMAHAPESYQALLKSRNPLNLYRMLPHAGPSAAAGFLALGSALLRDNELDSRLREIAILRVGLLSHASYEVHQHKRVARQVGLADDKVAALEIGADTTVLSDDERLVLHFTDAVCHEVKARDELFDQVAARFGHRQTAELVLTIGFYMLVSRFLENFEVDIEPAGTIK